ncbi:MAG TPA: CdaR family protein [Blastocatellia bacterium]|nr:CdaR family protein [Blastocatellia bacterium]
MDWLVDYRKAIKEYARDYVLENTGLKVIALLITAVLWLSVASRPVSQIALNGVPIVFHNVPPNLQPSKFPPLVARVYLAGPRDVVESLRGGQFIVTADMTAVEPGVRVIPLNVDPKSLPANIKVRDVEPTSITVTVERIIEREVPIIPRWEGKPAAGFEVIDWRILPSTVSISGAESQVRDITDVSTESVRLNDRTEPFTEQVAIDIGSPNLTLSENIRKVTLEVNIGEFRKERVVEVPVLLRGASSRIRTTPKFVGVTVYGPRSAVDAIGSGDVSAVVEYQPGIREVSPTVKISPAFEDRVVVRSVKPQTVRVR